MQIPAMEVDRAVPGLAVHDAVERHGHPSLKLMDHMRWSLKVLVSTALVEGILHALSHFLASLVNAHMS